MSAGGIVYVSKDPHQLTNLVNEADHQEALEQARSLLSEWTEQTGIPYQ